jgi:glycosyltransferase involved in cell wall biosynthesis
VNILAFIQPGTNSRSIMLDCARGFEKAGHRLFLWELAPMWAAYQRHAAIRPQLQSELSSIVRAFIEANRIDLSIGMWANTLLSLQNTLVQGAGPETGPRILSFFDAIDHPHALLWLDAPHWAHAGDFAQHFGTSLIRQRRVHHIINNPATAREMTDILGFNNVVARRYGVNPDIFRPYDLEKTFDIVFGSGPGDPPPTPAALAELESDDPDMNLVRRDAAATVESEIDAIAGPRDNLRGLLRMLIGMQLENRDEPMLDRLSRLRAMEPALAPEVDALLKDPRLFVKATMAIRGVERFERAFTISYLSRRFHCAVFGTGNFSAWGCRAQVLGELAYEDQAKAYSRGRLGLNVGRWQDDAGMNLKPLEITASGAVCLCAWRNGFDDLFIEGEEAASFRTPRDAAERTREILDSPPRLLTVAAAGRARILRDHTWERWAGAITAATIKA